MSESATPFNLRQTLDPPLNCRHTPDTILTLVGMYAFMSFGDAVIPKLLEPGTLLARPD
jgi:hypothetical protein